MKAENNNKKWLNDVETDNLLETFYQVSPLCSFAKICDTLRRIGIPAKNVENESLPILWQTAHLLQKRGKFYIVHFKQMHLLDGKQAVTNFTKEDRERLETIVRILENWGMIESFEEVQELRKVSILPKKDAENWLLKSKYTFKHRSKSV